MLLSSCIERRLYFRNEELIRFWVCKLHNFQLKYLGNWKILYLESSQRVVDNKIKFGEKFVSINKFNSLPTYRKYFNLKKNDDFFLII